MQVKDKVRTPTVINNEVFTTGLTILIIWDVLPHTTTVSLRN